MTFFEGFTIILILIGYESMVRGVARRKRV